MPLDVWAIEQKSEELPGTSVTFTLCTPLDFCGQQLPARQILTICDWTYRGPECGYTGAAYFDANDNQVDDPALDRCSQKLTGCECRYGANNSLPYGGFLCDVMS
jgi:lambda family phage minor tail protein L